MSMITITPIVVPPRPPALQPKPVAEPSLPNNKRSRDDDDGHFCESKRPRSCPTLADALASFLTTDTWPTELDTPSTPCLSTDTDSHSESSLETNSGYLVDNIPDAALESSSLSVGQVDASRMDGYRFKSDDDLLAWVCSLTDMGDEFSEENPSSSTTDVPTSPCASPPPILAVGDDRLLAEPSEEQPIHYIPPPVPHWRIVRGPARRTVDTEDLRRNVVNNLRWQRFYASETPTFPPPYERDLLPPQPLGTPPRNIDERTKLEPPASLYKYSLDPELATERDEAPRADEGASTYSASELWGPDADTVRVSRWCPLRPRGPLDFCELTSLEHSVCCKTDEATAAAATAEVYADPSAVEFWKASVNEVVEEARAAKVEEDTARLEAELRAFFEEAADDDDDGDHDDDDDDLEAVEIPDPEPEAEGDVSFDCEYGSTLSESSSEEDGEEVFDYDQWVADYLAL